MKYTPGPWKIVNPYNNDLREVVEDVSRYPIASYIENSANAKLIAAAPRLLEAAQALIDGIQEIIDSV